AATPSAPPGRLRFAPATVRPAEPVRPAGRKPTDGGRGCDQRKARPPCCPPRAGTLTVGANRLFCRSVRSRLDAGSVPRERSTAWGASASGAKTGPAVVVACHGLGLLTAGHERAGSGPVTALHAGPPNGRGRFAPPPSGLVPLSCLRRHMSWLALACTGVASWTRRLRRKSRPIASLYSRDLRSRNAMICSVAETGRKGKNFPSTSFIRLNVKSSGR